MLALSATFFSTQSFAQSNDIASDKEKQASLEKIKAHQAKLQKKYNSLTPEQAAEAKKRANDYKRGGYKEKATAGAKTTPKSKTTSTPAANPARTGSSNKNAAARKPTNTNTQVTAKPKPILLDAGGKPVSKTTTTTKAGVSPAKSTTPAKTIVPPSDKIPTSNPSSAPDKK